MECNIKSQSNAITLTLKLMVLNAPLKKQLSFAPIVRSLENPSLYYGKFMSHSVPIKENLNYNKKLAEINNND